MQAPERGRLRNPRPQAGRCRGGKPVSGRISGSGSSRRNASRCSTSRRWSASASRPRSASSTMRSIRTGCAVSISISSSICGRESLSPGNEQREFWGSQAADRPGSRNTFGIKNPAVDALIDRIIFAKDRAGLVAATKALDRVLLWNFYVVPQFTYSHFRATRAGIASAMPSRCRNTAVPACRRCGGTTPTRPPRSASDLEGLFAHGAASPAGMCSVSASAR